MALNPRIIACGNRRAAFAAAMRFLAGPAVMTVASYAVGLRGVLLHVAIIQVSLNYISVDVWLNKSFLYIFPHSFCSIVLYLISNLLSYW